MLSPLLTMYCAFLVNLNLMYEHESTPSNKSMNISIKLESLQLSLQHQQLKAILKIIKSV